MSTKELSVVIVLMTLRDINDSTISSEPYTRHTGQFGSQPYEDVEELRNVVEQHIEEEHGDDIDIETGATLASGTTIASNTAVHLGNETFIDKSGDTLQGALTLNGNSLNTGGSAATIRDTTNALDVLRADEGGNVQIPNGELTVSGTVTAQSNLIDSAGNVIYDQSSNSIEQSRLANDSVTINAGTNLTGGGTVSLGGSITLDAEAGYTDSDAISAINNDADHGSTASHNYFSGSHTDLTNITPDAHHARYTDAEVQAVNWVSIL